MWMFFVQVIAMPCPVMYLSSYVIYIYIEDPFRQFLACPWNFGSSGFCLTWMIFFGDQTTIQPNKQTKSERQNFEITSIRCCMDMWYVVDCCCLFTAKGTRNLKRKRFQLLLASAMTRSMSCTYFLGKRKAWSIWIIRIMGYLYIYIMHGYTQ